MCNQIAWNRQNISRLGLWDFVFNKIEMKFNFRLLQNIVRWIFLRVFAQIRKNLKMSQRKNLRRLVTCLIFKLSLERWKETGFFFKFYCKTSWVWIETWRFFSLLIFHLECSHVILSNLNSIFLSREFYSVFALVR